MLGTTRQHGLDSVRGNSQADQTNARLETAPPCPVTGGYKMRTAAARPAEGLGGWRALPGAHSNGRERNCWNSPLCAAANQQEHNQFPSRRLSIDGSFLTGSCLKNSLLQWGEGNKQPSLSWERPPYPPAYSLSKPMGEPQERGSYSGNWLLLTFFSAGAVHWPFPHLCDNPPALTPSLHLRVTLR